MADFFTDTSQYDLARKRAAAQSNVDLQTRQDALNRRFASLGNLDSGAQLKQQEIAANDVNSKLADTNAGIDAAQTADLANRAGIKQGQDFQTSERLGAQSFQSGLQGSAQAFADAQRLGTQDFANTQRLGSQDFQGAQAGLARAQQASQFASSTDLANQQFNEAKNQFAQTFAEDQLTNQRNYILAQDALNKQGVLESTLGSLNSSPIGNTLKDLGIPTTTQDIVKGAIIPFYPMISAAKRLGNKVGLPW